MTAYMYDSDNETYPADARYIAAYVDGSRTGNNYNRAKGVRPDARFWLISAVGEADGDVIDIEPGNVWPPENAVPWIRRQLARGVTPAYYCNTSTQQQCLDAFAAAWLPPLPWWRADYRPESQRPASFALGEIAHQYANPPMTGAHWDASIISDDLVSYLERNSGSVASEAIAVAPVAPAPVKPAQPPWPGGFGPNDYLGDINGPSNSHGGDPRYDGPDVIAAIRWAQQMLILGGNVPGISDPNSSWADGVYGPETVAAVTRWQMRDWAVMTSWYGEIWPDDYGRM